MQAGDVSTPHRRGWGDTLHEVINSLALVQLIHVAHAERQQHVGAAGRSAQRTQHGCDRLPIVVVLGVSGTQQPPRLSIPCTLTAAVRIRQGAMWCPSGSGLPLPRDLRLTANTESSGAHDCVAPQCGLDCMALARPALCRTSALCTLSHSRACGSKPMNHHSSSPNSSSTATTGHSDLLSFTGAQRAHRTK